MIETLLYFGLPFIGLPIGFLLGFLPVKTLRIASLIFLFALPFLAAFVILLFSGPWKDDNLLFALWLGAILFCIPVVLWLFCLLGGFGMGRAAAKKRAQSRFR